MRLGKKPPARRPHPDPARELELLRILDLRASITRRTELVAQYRREIRALHAEARGETNIKRAGIYLQQAEVLHQRILEVEESIPATHEQIAALQSKIPADDLAYL